MGRDQTILVFKDGTYPFHVCLEGWDNPIFCLIGGIMWDGMIISHV
jgi:hypothetical protein